MLSFLTTMAVSWCVSCRVQLAEGVDYLRTADVKDQIELSGNDIKAVSMTGE